MLTLVPPIRPIGSEEIFDARSPAGNCALKHLLGYAKEPFDSGGRKTIRRDIGMQSCAKKDLIRVDVPDPGKRLLVHEERFQPAPTVLEEPAKIFQGDRQGIVTESSGDIPIHALLIQ
jgi:hypothetical protein